MKKLITIAAIFIIGCSKTPPPIDIKSDNKPTPTFTSKTTCQEILEVGKYFSTSDAIFLPEERIDGMVFKDQFESTKDFNLRKQRAIENTRVKAESVASKLGISGIVKFKYTYSYINPTYNADRELITVPSPDIASRFGELSNNPKLKGFRSGFEFKSEDGPTDFGAYNTKTNHRRSSGIAFKTQLKHPFLLNKQKNVSFNEPPEIAKELLQVSKSRSPEDIGTNIALAVAGRLIPPYLTSSGYSHDDLNTLTTTAYSSSTLYLDVTCAAIIDRRTNKILVELH